MAINLQIGSTVGDYQIIGMLGAGGMGKVYKVRNVISDRIEAMKVLLPDLAGDTELADRFMREIKVQASLEHPHIAALHTALRIDNQLLMLMEFVEGVTLEHKLKDGPLPLADGVEYISQVLSALDYAHQRGVVHRDIKPANMMLTPAGVIKLMDFGIAKAATDRRLTMTGTTMGSLYYMSPEQIQGAADLDARADLYSVGVSLYELVTGKRPFDGDSQFAIMSAHLEKTPVPPISLDPAMPQPLNDAILMSVAKDRSQRFQTAAAFRAALGNVAGVLKPAAVAAAAANASPRAAAAATVVAAPSKMPPGLAPAPPPAPKPKSGRSLWVAAGGLATALVVVGVIQFGPWKGTSAAQMPGGSAPIQSSAPLQQAPAQTSVQSPASRTPAQQVPAQQNPNTPSPSAASSSQLPSRPAPARTTAPAGSQLLRQAGTPLQTPPAGAQQQASPAASPQAPPTQPVSQSPPPQAQQQPSSRPAADPAKQAELQKVREDLVMLQTRASVLRDSLQRLQQQQASSGLGLRGDMREASGLMNSYLEGAVSALNAGDSGSARGFMDKAERQIEKLEKFLGR
jgi:serine/threonine-protein kinase